MVSNWKEWKPFSCSEWKIHRDEDELAHKRCDATIETLAEALVLIEQARQSVRLYGWASKTTRELWAATDAVVIKLKEERWLKDGI